MKGFIQVCLVLLIVWATIGVLSWETRRNEQVQNANQQFDRDLLEAKRHTLQSKCGEYLFKVVEPVGFSVRKQVVVFAGEELTAELAEKLVVRREGEIISVSIPSILVRITYQDDVSEHQEFRPKMLWHSQWDCPVVTK